jgi:hypothetical protein
MDSHQHDVVGGYRQAVTQQYPLSWPGCDIEWLVQVGIT